jgi:hypothetical protein
MFWTENEIVVSNTSYTRERDKWLGLPGADKLSLTVTGGSVYLQTTESQDRGDYPEPVGSEMLLAPAFHSMPLAGRIFSYRLRAQSGAVAVVTVRASG